MKEKIIIFTFFIFLSLHGQEDKLLLESLFEKEDIQESEKLLPERMVFTQSILWGKNGIFRKTGISNLNKEQRVKELKANFLFIKKESN